MSDAVERVQAVEGRDLRRVSDVSPAELIEAGIAALGWSGGAWTVELAVVDGVIRKVHATASSGRNALLVRRLDVRESDAA